MTCFLCFSISSALYYILGVHVYLVYSPIPYSPEIATTSKLISLPSVANRFFLGYNINHLQKYCRTVLLVLHTWLEQFICYLWAKKMFVSLLLMSYDVSFRRFIISTIMSIALRWWLKLALLKFSQNVKRYCKVSSWRNL